MYLTDILDKLKDVREADTSTQVSPSPGFWIRILETFATKIVVYSDQDIVVFGLSDPDPVLVQNSSKIELFVKFIN